MEKFEKTILQNDIQCRKFKVNMSSSHSSHMPKSFPMIQLENSTVGSSAVIYNIHDHSTTLAPIKSILEYTFDDIFNATNENTTNLYSDSSDDSFNHYENHTNQTIDDSELSKRDHVFDRTDVRVIFITMYTLVFCCCFFGK